MTRNPLEEIKKGFPVKQTLKSHFGKQVARERDTAVQRINGMCSWALQRFIWLKGNRSLSLSLSSTRSQKVHFFKTLWNWAQAGDEYEFPLPAISSTDCTQNVHLNRVNDRPRVRGELHLRGQFSACVLVSTLHSSLRLLSFSMPVRGRWTKS